MTSRDPMEQYDDLVQSNRYSYAGGNAANFIDPQGTSILSAAYNAAKSVVKKSVLVLKRFSYTCIVYRWTVRQVKAGYYWENGFLRPKYVSTNVLVSDVGTCFSYSWVWEGL